jgi:hypothetical protein
MEFRTAVFYRMIKKSLCTWRLKYDHQVHRDFLIILYIVSHTFIQLYGVKGFYLSKPLSPCFFTVSRPSGFSEELGHTRSTCLEIWHIITSRTPFVYVISNKQWGTTVYCRSTGMRFSLNSDGSPARSQSWECCSCITDAVMTRKCKLLRRKSLRNHSTLDSKVTYVLQETYAAELLW